MTVRRTRINNVREEIPHESPGESRLMAICIALATELAVVRERLDTVERLAESAGVFRQAEVEAFEPDPPAAAARDGLRQRLLKHVFRVIRMDGERAAQRLAR
jgi:hypothetical protein